MSTNIFSIPKEENTRWVSYGKAVAVFLETFGKLVDVPEERNTTVAYATPSTAWAKNIIPMINGETKRPFISFSLTSEESVNETSLVYPYFHTPIKDENGNIRMFKFRAPIIKELTYKCDVFASTRSEIDMILNNIEFQAWEKRPYYTKVNGRGTEIIMKNISDATELNPNQGALKIQHCSFELIILRAMIFPAEEEEVGVIKKINIEGNLVGY